MVDSAAGKPQRELSLAALMVEHFTPLVGEAFTLHRPEGGALQLRLTEARASSAGARPAGMRAPFSLVFHCPELPASQYIVQGNYRIEHPSLGAHTIFITPVTPDSAGVRYEAVFA